MAGDIEVYNAAGLLHFRATDYLARILGFLDIGTTDGSYTYPGAISGTLFANFLPPFMATGLMPTVTVSGSTIYWTFPGPIRTSGRIIFGMY